MTDRRVALVTGASKGLGRVVAAHLAGRGHDLIVTARTRTVLEATARNIATAANVVSVAGDIADPGHRARLADTVERLGRLDVLVNNASALGPSPLLDLADLRADTLTDVFDTNVVAPIALAQTAIPSLAKHRGLIVNVTSDAARGAYPGWGAYGASKAALELASRTLAAELAQARTPIGVVSVDPGDMRTDMHQAAFAGEDISDRPPPDVTLAFWAWLFSQDPPALTGRHYRAQADVWETAA